MSEEISTYQGPRLIQISGNKIEWVNHGETLQYFRTLFKYILIFYKYIHTNNYIKINRVLNCLF